MYKSTEDIKKNRAVEKIFESEKDTAFREQRMKKWRRAVERSLGWAEE